MSDNRPDRLAGATAAACVLCLGVGLYQPAAGLVVAGSLIAWSLRGLVDARAAGRRIAATEAARAHAEAQAAATTRFVTDLSHEIRTPMNGVIGMAAALEETPLDPSQRGMVAILRSSGESMVRLLNAVLDLSRIEAGHMELSPAPFSLAALVDNIEALNAPAARRKGIDFAVERPGDAAADWAGQRIGDSERIRQILQNLVSNAIKFTEKGGVRLGIVACARTDEVRFRVGDTGIGMTEEAAARVFRPYEQASADTRARFGGSGLGLAISRRLAEKMGGRIVLESVAGRGSEFTFAVPLARVAAADPAAAPRAQARIDAAGRRILIADDNATNVRVLMALMRHTGAEITAVTTGVDAVAAHEAERFDLVFMDISMPGMDGIEALHLMRAAERRDNRGRVPVVAFTGFAFDHEVSRIMDEGFDSHIAKPVDVDRFYSVLGDMLGRPGSASSSAA